MAPDRCWSSIVVGPADSALLGLRPGGASLVGCDLSDGHSGLHSSDGGRGGTVRRTWVMWGDYARGPQPGRMLDPCHGLSAAGGACTLYEGHGGAHRFLAAPAAAPDTPAYSTSPPSFPVPAARTSAARSLAAPPSWPAAASVDSVYPSRGRHGLVEEPYRSAPLASPSTAPAVPAAAPAARPAGPPRAAASERRTVAPDPAPVPPATPAPAPVAERSKSEETVTDKSRSSKHGKQKPGKHGKDKHGQDKHKGKADEFRAPPPPTDSGPEVRVSDLRDLGSLLQVNDYADRSRTSFIEVIEPDGTSRTVVAPVSAEPPTRTPVEKVPAAGPVPAVHRYARTADSAPESDDRFSALSKLKVTTVAASTAAASQAVESVSAAVDALPDEQLLVRRQVGEALRDVAAALAKLAESLDPR